MAVIVCTMGPAGMGVWYSVSCRDGCVIQYVQWVLQGWVCDTVCPAGMAVWYSMYSKSCSDGCVLKYVQWCVVHYIQWVYWGWLCPKACISSCRDEPGGYALEDAAWLGGWSMHAWWPLMRQVLWSYLSNHFIVLLLHCTILTVWYSIFSFH